MKESLVNSSKKALLTSSLWLSVLFVACNVLKLQIPNLATNALNILLIACSTYILAIIYAYFEFKKELRTKIIQSVFFASGISFAILCSNLNSFHDAMSARTVTGMLFILTCLLLAIPGLKITYSNLVSRLPINKTNLLLVAGLTILGFILRIWDLGGDSLWVDETWHTFAALKGNGLIEIFGIYNNAPLASVITYVAGAFFGFHNEFYLRLPFAILGTLLIPLCFFIGKQAKNNMTGLIFAYFTALSPILVIFSREIRFYILIALFTLLILFFYNQYIKTNNWKYINLIFFTSVISVISVPYYFLVVLPVLFSTKIITHIKSIILNKNFLISFLICSGAVGITFISEFLWIFKKETVELSKFFYSNQILILEFLFVLLIILSFATIKKNWNIILFLIAILITLNFVNIQNARYILFIIPLVYFLSAIASDEIYNKLREKNVIVSKIFVIYLIAFPIINIQNFQLYKNDYTLSEDIESKQTTVDFFDLKSYLNSEKLLRVPSSNIKPDYKESLEYLKALYPNEKLLIIAESPETIRYYNYLNSYDFELIHPYERWDTIDDKINSHEGLICGIIGYRIKLNEKKQVDQKLIDYIGQNMHLLKELTGLEIWCVEHKISP